MKKFILFLSLVFFCFSSESYAGRFGGGKSFGQHRSSQTFKRSNPTSPQKQQPPHNTQTPAKSSFMSKIFPALAGLSLGAMFASLLGGHGIMGGLSSILMIVMGFALLMIVVGLLKRLFASKQKTATNYHHFQQASAEPQTHAAGFGQTYQEQPRIYDAPSYSSESYFDASEFLRNAKTIFIRMQTAYDDKNLTDIRTFTTPEVFAEIQLQLQERGNAVNKTEIIHIDATLAEELNAHDDTASVLFSGQVREEQNSAPVYVKEVWNFVKKDNQWVIAGIEQ